MLVQVCAFNFKIIPIFFIKKKNLKLRFDNNTGTMSVTMDGPAKVSLDCTEIDDGYKARYFFFKENIPTIPLSNQ